MKKLILFTIVALIAISTTAQKIRFTDTSNRWNERWYAQNPIMHYETFSFDTFRNYNGYHYEVMTSYTSPYNPIHSAMVREDTSAGIVYIRAAGDTSERILYNYNASIGDTTIVVSSSFPDTLVHVVEKIDSTRINNTWHKILHYKCLNNTYSHFSYTVVEGIGCQQGIFFPVEPHYSEGNSRLYCFQNSGVNPILSPAVSLHFFNDSFDNASSCLLSIESKSKQYKQVKVYPQPAKDYLTFELPYNITNGNISIFNILGQEVYHNQFRNAALVRVYNNELFKPGLYLYRIADEQLNKLYTGKVMFNRQ